MIEELVARVFQARDISHRAHWATNSYAQHMALGDFYDNIIDDLDSIVECYQGQFGLIGDDAASRGSPLKRPDIINYLQEEFDWIKEHRDEICQESTQIENLLDSLLERYSVTLYKLENLR